MSHPSRSYLHRPPAPSWPPSTDTKSFLFDGALDSAQWIHSAASVFGINTGVGAWSISVWFKTSYDAHFQDLLYIRNSSAGRWMRIHLGKSSSPYSLVYQALNSSMTWSSGNGGFGSDSASTHFGLARTGSGNQICDGQWHHVVVTCEGVPTTGKVKLYTDGSLSSYGTQTTSACNANNAFILGDGPTANFNGEIFQMSAYRAELSAMTVTALYSGGYAMDPSSLSPYLYYRMGDHAGDTPSLIKDSGLAGLDLAGVGAPTIVTDSPP